MREQIAAVQRMQDYIEAHLYEEITLVDLARASAYSPWYANRLFTQWLGRTPADYIRRLRLSKSALKLRDARVKVADVAFEVGFSSVDGYQRAFYREFGYNPRQYAANPVPLWLFTPYRVLSTPMNKEKTMDQLKTVFVQEVIKPARRVLVKRGVTAEDYYRYCEEVGCEIWGLLLSIQSALGEPVALWLPKHFIKPGTSQYVQGVEMVADYSGPVPEGFDAIDLPAATYLLFRGEPFAEEDYEQAIGEVWEAIRKYNPGLMGYEWDESNPRIQLEPSGARGYMELVAVRKK
ncbi:MAG TPA: AraC family transcriptional regulator [Candidatus Limiplasma sp.]|nr:AraC family transcriptional regulator [Candidatus Limiplasma sp.]